MPEEPCDDDPDHPTPGGGPDTPGGEHPDLPGGVPSHSAPGGGVVPDGDRQEEPVLVGGGRRGTISDLINFPPVTPRPGGVDLLPAPPTTGSDTPPGRDPAPDADPAGAEEDLERFREDRHRDLAASPAEQGEYGGPPPEGGEPYRGFVVPAAAPGVAGWRLVRERDPETGEVVTWQEILGVDGSVVDSVPLGAPDDPRPAPEEHEVRRMMRDLAAGRRSAAEVAAWASHWVGAEEVTVTGTPVWEALVELSGAALTTPAGHRLHGPADHAAWTHAYERDTR